MAESNATQVVLTDDGIKIINAQNTANNAAGGVNDLNDPNLMSVIEKQNTISQFAGLTSQYNVLVQNAKDDGIDTTAVTTAYNNLNRFMADILADPDHASDVDRARYKKYQDVYNEELAKLQNALQNNTNDKFTSAASATSQAASTANAAKSAADSTYSYANSEIAVQLTATAKAQSAADGAFSQAQVVGSQADSAIAVQSTATAKAQSAADNAFAKAESTASAFGPVSKKADSAFANAMSAQNDASSAVAKAESTASEFGKVSQKADSAFDNALSAQNDASNAVAQASSAAADSKDAKQIAGAVSQSYKTLTDGSTMTIAELQNGLAAKLTKSDLDGYATQTWTQNQIKVTADGINGTMSSIKGTVDGQTTSINDLKADSSSFKSQFTTVNNTLGKQTTDIGTLQASSKELTSGFNTLTTDNKTNKNDISQLRQTATEVSSTLETVQTQVQDSAVGTNLIIQSDLKNGYLNGADGSVQSSSIDFNSDYIATNGATIFTFSSPDYVFKGSINHALIMYDSDKNYLGWQPITSETQTLSKSNAAYIRFSINSANEGDTSGNSSDWLSNHRYKLEKGSVATDYSVNPEDTASVTAVSSISQTVDSMQSDISKKIEQKDLNGYATETWAQNKIKTTADGITGTLSSVKDTVDSHTTSINDLKAGSNGFKDQFTKVNDTLGKHTTDISTLQSDAKSLSSNFDSLNTANGTNQHNISELQQTAKEFNSTLETVQTQVQNSAVGTNLLVGTSRDLQTAPNSSAKDVGGLVRTFSQEELNFLAGKQVTLRAFIHNPTDHTVNLVLWTRGSTIPFGVGTSVPAGTDGYSTITAYNISSSVPAGDISIRAYAEDTAISGVQYKELKLEKGSIATDWCPNPADNATKSQITQLSGQIDQKVDSGDFSTYKTQTTNLIAEKVANSDFTTYKSQTADLISSKVETKDFSSYKDETAKSIGSMVKSKDFESYKTQTAGMIDSKVSNSNYTSDMKQMAGQIDQKVSSGDFNSYKTQTDKLIAEKVSNGDFSTYKSQTADLISSKVATKDFSAYQATTAKAIESKVESSDFNTYKTQTADMISSKVSAVVDGIGQSQGRNYVRNSRFDSHMDNWYVTAGTNILTIDTTDASKTNLGKMGLHIYGTTTDHFQGIGQTIPLKMTKGQKFVIGMLQSFDGEPRSGNLSIGVHYRDSNGTILSQEWHALNCDAGWSNVYGRNSFVYTAADDCSSVNLMIYAPGPNYHFNAYITEVSLTVGPISFGWTPALEDQASQSQITQLSGDINLRVTKDGLLDQINLQAGKTLISSSGQLTLSGKSIYFDTQNPVIIPSANIDKLLVGKQLTAADISANTFSTNNGTFTVEKNGAITAKDMTLSGGKLYSPTINAGTITGVTINGTTFHGGDVINNQHNTSHLYPMTIEPNGAYKTTFYDQMVGLQSIIESGGLQHKFRSMVADSDGHFVASNAALDGQGFHSQSGYTSAKDSTFSSPQTITGYVDVTPSSGIYLYGPTQKINFAGNKDNIGSDGITMDSYGNMYGQPNSLYWRIGDANAKAVADFGFDTANKRDILLYRNVSVGNLFLGVGHTIGMLDKKPLYFKQGTSSGDMLDIKAGTVYYTGLTKSSLLSVKKDVKKADTAYWAQLVNSIDLATYQYKSDDNTSHIRLSSIVDDVNDTKQWRLPDIFISRDEDGKLSGVDDSVLLNAILATVQEQQKEIDQLNGHNMELEARLNKLEAKLNE